MVPGTLWYLDWAGQEECSQAGSLCSLSCLPISQGSYSQSSLSLLPGWLGPPRAGGAAPWEVMARNTPLSSTLFDSLSGGLSICLFHFTLSTSSSVPCPAASELPGIITVLLPCPSAPSGPQLSKVQVSKWDFTGSGLCFPQECCCQPGLP